MSSPLCPAISRRKRMLVQTCQRALAMVFALAGCFTCCGVFGSDVWADLRIETTVQVGNDGSTSNNLTLFTNAGVYDYASDTTDLKPTGITFFNPSLATVTVLDPGRQKQLTLRIQQLDAMVREKLRVPSSGPPPPGGRKWPVRCFKSTTTD